MNETYCVLLPWVVVWLNSRAENPPSRLVAADVYGGDELMIIYCYVWLIIDSETSDYRWPKWAGRGSWAKRNYWLDTVVELGQHDSTRRIYASSWIKTLAHRASPTRTMSCTTRPRHGTAGDRGRGGGGDGQAQRR